MLAKRRQAGWLRTIVLMAVACWSLGSLSGCSRFDSDSAVALADEWPTARKSVLVFGRGEAGQAAFRSYLGYALRPELEAAGEGANWAYGRDDQRGAAFGFFLYEARPLVATVVGRGNGREVAFFAGGQELARSDFSAGKLRFEIPVQSLRAGWNWVEVENAAKVGFREFSLRTSDAALSAGDGRPYSSRLSVDEKDILLPFGQSLDFALDSPGQSLLQVELSPWADEGAPPLAPSNLQLSVRTRTEAGAESEWTLLGEGRQELPLPDGLGRFALQLRAELKPGQAAPLPGQAGIKLAGLTLQRSQAPMPGPTFPLEPTLEPTPAASSTAGSASELGTDNAKGPRPNVILVVVDTLRADRLSSYGFPHPTSPHLEALSKDSVVFERAIAEAPWTKPTVASILTGLEPNQHRALDFGDHLDSTLPTWAEILKEGGYQTYAAVANPLVGPQFGFDKGFEKFQLLPVTGRASDVHRVGLEMLKDRKPDQPFFLYLHPIDPHLPYDPPAAWRDRSLDWTGLDPRSLPPSTIFPTIDRKGFTQLTTYLFLRFVRGLDPQVPESTSRLVHALYDGEVASTDAALGDVIAWLKSEGLYQSSLIVFTSDHGEELLERRRLGHMHTLYQELLHVPLVIKFPHNQHKGERTSELWQQIDILPTVLAALGLPTQGPMDGVPFPSTIPNSRAALFEVMAGRDAKEAGQAIASFLEAGSGLIKGPLKLIHHDSSLSPNDMVRGLFDLASDPGEQNNLILERPVETLFLEKELALRKTRSARVLPKRASKEDTRDILKSLEYLH